MLKKYLQIFLVTIIVNFTTEILSNQCEATFFEENWVPEKSRARFRQLDNDQKYTVYERINIGLKELNMVWWYGQPEGIKTGRGNVVFAKYYKSWDNREELTLDIMRRAVGQEAAEPKDLPDGLAETFRNNIALIINQVYKESHTFSEPGVENDVKNYFSGSTNYQSKNPTNTVQPKKNPEFAASWFSMLYPDSPLVANTNAQNSPSLSIPNNYDQDVGSETIVYPSNYKNQYNGAYSKPIVLKKKERKEQNQ